MNAVEHGQGTSPSSGNAPDVTKKANFVIWAYFFAFGIGLYLMIAAVNIYFRIETEREAYIKVGSVPSKELADQRAEEADILSGKISFFEGKKHISIDDAMNKVLQVTQ